MLLETSLLNARMNAAIYANNSYEYSPRISRGEAGDMAGILQKIMEKMKKRTSSR
ncbi:MAG: hypothetical protein ACOX6S_06845 [Clostridia bacterium]